MTRSNTPELVGHAAIYSGAPTPCIYPDLIMRLEVNAARSSVDFVHLFLQGRTAREFVRAKAKGTNTTMKKINQATVMNIPFPASTSLATQAAILARMTRLAVVHDRIKEGLAGSKGLSTKILTASITREFGQPLAPRPTNGHRDVRATTA
jgi:type I restriction enzyme S subunit